MSSDEQEDTGQDTPEAGGASDEQAQTKRAGELAYWSKRKNVEGALKNSWFERFYTDHFGLSREDYRDKRVLDIGCGPRGSLEWATMARERVGVDPIANEYLQMGAAEHAMTYVAAGAESIPFPDHSFDIVCSFNSLDHVDDLDASIAELKRLTAVGGLLLVLTDVHDEPTPQEPVCFDWSVVELFAPEFAVQSLRCCEKQGGGAYQSAEQGIFFNHADSRQRYGVLSARFVRVEAPEAEAPPSPEEADSAIGRMLITLGERARTSQPLKDAESAAGRLLHGARARARGSAGRLLQAARRRGGRHARR